MTAQLPSDEQACADLVRIAGMSDGPHRRRATARFHADHEPLYLHIAKQVRRHHSIPPHLFPDIAQEVRLAAVKLVDQIVDQNKPNPVNLRTYGGYVRTYASRAARDAWNTYKSPLSGRSGQERSLRHANVVRAELEQKLHRAPTDEEVASTYNDVVRRTRKNPEKSGQILTADDLRFNGVRSLDQTYDDEARTSEPADASVFEMLWAERRDAEDHVSDLLARLDAAPVRRLGCVLRAWLSDATTTDTAQILNVSTETIRRDRKQINDIACQMAVADWRYDPEAMEDWRLAGTDGRAREWAEAGFGPSASSAWITRGVTDPSEAFARSEAGETPAPIGGCTARAARPADTRSPHKGLCPCANGWSRSTGVPSRRTAQEPPRTGP